MTIVRTDFIQTKESFIEDKCVAFDELIKEIDDFETLTQKYPHAEIIDGGKNSVLYAGFINTHVHLEFSANKTTLEYGDFMSWLYSVIESREELKERCDTNMMINATKEMMESGITTFGAISSFGMELEACSKTPQKVIFFNELIGSIPSSVDFLYQDFLARLEESSHYDNITPAIAIHSPYSVHPIVIKKALALAKEQNYPISAHFLESSIEREWLENGEGEFKTFFKEFFNTSSPVNSIDGFLLLFDETPTHFTHAVKANEKELEHLSQKNHSIAHCPRSNRLLGSGRLDIKDLKVPFSVATDGLSSNYSLNIFDELRSALMLHSDIELKTLANDLIKSVTSIPAKIFNLNCGAIECGFSSDLAIITLPDKPKIDTIALNTILHTSKVDMLFIDGKQII
jgi:cytosine/adenosine deaminase-related metal-dependent hydrolase